MGTMREGLLEGGWSLKDARRRDEGDSRSADGRVGTGQDADADGRHHTRLDAERLGRLAGVIEGEIIPRLMMAHRTHGGSNGRVANHPEVATEISPEHVAQFTDLVLEDEIGPVRDFCTDLLREGAAPPGLLVGLLAPCARRLGTLWDEDQVDFTAVTVGLCRLQQVMREISHACEYDDEAVGAPRVLLAPAPGEQHTFGMLMVAEFFRRAGWEVAGDCALSPAELRDMVSRDWFAVVGLSAAYDTMLPELAEAIASLRECSRNPDLQVLVGGRVFADNPALAHEVGADATAADAEGALALAQEILVRKAVLP
ncbi:MAG: cobalamin B12-binding domain-containing protein [Gammaproteobacteria bacterium]|nr:MAG: cobalamin B12-binding domain-containing protein [Gammaproteobacteria bacterium]